LQNSELNKDLLHMRQFVKIDLLYSQKLNTQIETIEENGLKELKTMVDLGSQFYCQALM
jgi:hypothetical protein